jgi:glycosyltransferase involved in cell wall biosynthesis
MLPTISIVTVTLNAAAVLPRLLASLRCQSDREFDFVVIDGASQDQTWALLQGARDVVTFAVSEPDRGLYDALNKAIRVVKSDYYVVLGADDTLDPDAICNFRKAASASAADVVVAGVKKGDRILTGYYPDRAWLGYSAMVTSHSVGMLLRVNLHTRFGEYSARYPLLADGHFIKQICTDPSVSVVRGDFVAGEFCLSGVSNRQFVRTLCETWQIQLDTGEPPLLQYLLFQARLLKNIFKVLQR